MKQHESYVNLLTAKMLKKAGFDWDVYEGYAYYENGNSFAVPTQSPTNFNQDANNPLSHSYVGSVGSCSRPTLAVAQRWLREEKGWFLEVAHFGKDYFDERVDGDEYEYVNEEHEEKVERLLEEYPNKEFYTCYCYFNNCMYIDPSGATYEEALEKGIQAALKELPLRRLVDMTKYRFNVELDANFVFSIKDEVTLDYGVTDNEHVVEFHCTEDTINKWKEELIKKIQKTENPFKVSLINSSTFQVEKNDVVDEIPEGGEEKQKFFII